MSIKGQDHYLAFAKGHCFQLKYFFSKTIEIFETKYHVENVGSTEMKMNTNGLDHKTKMAAMPIYSKKIKALQALQAWAS